MNKRIETDTLGAVEIEDSRLWGAQTQRSFNNFKIGSEKMPLEMIYAIAIVKKAAANANRECGTLSDEKCALIGDCCDRILSGSWDEHFPLVVWQTGSGTQTNMNVNEVIAHGAQLLNADGPKLSPNDDVNKSQSTNDVFPTAMRISSTLLIFNKLLPELKALLQVFEEKSAAFAAIKKIGRTHLMDATPLTLGEEFSAFASQLKHGIRAIELALPHLMELPIGGTAVGNGINTPAGYDKIAVQYINQFTALNFTPSENKFEAMASHDSFVEISGALKRVAVSLIKIGNDIRLLASGPRCGLGELIIPSNEPGSSIMPGKVNPTQCEALTMVGCQVIGNDAAISSGAMQGHLQLNVFMPLIARNIIHSIHLLSDAVNSFNIHCAQGIEPDLTRIEGHLRSSLMLVTALSPHIGYYKAAEIAQYAHANNLTLREAALKLQYISAEDYDKIIDKTINNQ